MSEIETTVAKARELANGATKGPWHMWESGPHHGSASFVETTGGSAICETIEGSKDDSRFIAASRELVPQLCDIIDRLARERNALINELAIQTTAGDAAI